MSNLLASLTNSAGALAAFSQALTVTQNNVANASTPGWVKQRQLLNAQPFDPAVGVAGGVRAGAVTSARSIFAEKAVWRENVALGYATQKAETLSALNQTFDVTATAGIPYALNNFYKSASAFSQSPTDTIARQTLLDRADEVAMAFRRTVATTAQLRENSESQIGQTVSQINNLVSQLAEYNKNATYGTMNDSGVDAQIYATVEQLSEFVDVTAVQQENGSVMVLVDGQYPLLIGQQQFPLRVAMEPDPDPVNPNAAPKAHIYNGEKDITEALTSGKLGGLLEVRNELIPSLTGDAYQDGSVNVLAKQFADRVNSILTSGYISDKNGMPESGVPLFTYDATNPASVATTLAVESGLTPDKLAAIDPGPPYLSNGIGLRLSALATPQDAADEIDGVSFTEYYAQIAAKVGSQLASAKDAQSVQQSTLAQAQELRQQMSGVSLDEEAMILVQFQRAYQACSKLITILDQLTEVAINMKG